MTETPLYDPENYGNKPGDGPLRAGGQPFREGDGKEDRADRVSKAAAAQQGPARLCRDLYQGQDAVHGRGQEYLPKAVAEGPSDYESRKKRTPFHNFFARAADGLVGLVYQTDPDVTDVPPLVEKHLENIDLAGTHFDVFARDICSDSMKVGHAGILVEFPDTDGSQSFAAELEGEIRPYWVPYAKEQIINWRASIHNGRQRLDMVVLHEKATVPDGIFAERERSRYRVIRRTETGVIFEVWEKVDDAVVPALDEDGEPIFGTYANQTEIPFVEVATSGKTGLFESKPPLLDVAHLNLAHYQQLSDKIEAMHKTVPFLLTLGMNPYDENGMPITEIAVGPTMGLNISAPEGDARYVAHTGNGISEMGESLQELKADMGSLSLAMLAPQKRVAETAEAKRLDKSQSDSALAVTARAWQDALERAFVFHMAYLRLDSPVEVVVNRDFEGTMMDADTMRAYADLLKVGLPESIVLRVLQEGGRIPEDVDLENVVMEMVAQQAAEEARGEADRIARQEALRAGGMQDPGEPEE